MLKGKSLIDKARQSQLADYLNEANMSEGAGPKLKQILMRGVGVHHAGVLPRYRRMVEELFQRKLLSVCVCTETLAAGINLPARSVVLPSLLKGPAGKKKVVEPSTAHQIFGRAGRPQFDDRGFVYALAHEDDVKIHRWRLQYDSIPEDTKDLGLLKMKKQLKKKMPKRRTDEQYWTQSQFDALRDAPAAKLASRGPLPWRLLAYMLLRSSEVEPLRHLVGRRLLDSKSITDAQRELNRMLITLWTAGYIQLEPRPQFAAGGGSSETTSKAPLPDPERGLFDGLISRQSPGELAEHPQANQAADEDSGRVDILAGRVMNWTTIDLSMRVYGAAEWLVQLRSVHPLYGIYLADQLAIADPEERIMALESVLDVPGTVAKLARVPSYDRLPAGTLAKLRLDTRLLQLGLATPAN